MSGSTFGPEDLLERRLPSALSGEDAAQSAGGVPDAELAEAKGTVAAIGLAVAPAAPAPGVRERVLASRARSGRFGAYADRIARMFDLSVDDAEALLQRAEDPGAWAPFLIEGLEMIPVVPGPRCSGAIATLVRIQPGVTFPEHDHSGEETMLVLEGGFREGSGAGEEVWRGDEILRGQGTGHSLVGLPGVPCVAAAVIFGYADFK